MSASDANVPVESSATLVTTDTAESATSLSAGSDVLMTLRHASDDEKIATLTRLFQTVPLKIIAALERARVEPEHIKSTADGPAILDIVIDKAPKDLLAALRAISPAANAAPQ